jgi:polyisoprenoid-binding protein YceI
MSQFEGLTAGTWVIDPSHSEIGFTVRHLMSKVRGKFEEFEGSVVVADEPGASVATATSSPRSTRGPSSGTTTCAPATSSTPPRPRR